MAENSKYEWQLAESCRLVAGGVGPNPWKLVYQSRSGSPHHPWLEPDVCDYIKTRHEQRPFRNLAIAPIGFISDHMEVAFDLDAEAKELCDKLGVGMHRAATVGTDDRFVTMIRLLVEERMASSPNRLCLGTHGPSHDVCPEDCCLPGARPPARR
jgi:ferrochelatase